MEKPEIAALDTSMEDINDYLEEIYLNKAIEKGCNHSQGLQSQSVYGCMTCDKGKGYCLACISVCHKEHEIFEIGPRKKFICDCPSFGCQLFKNEEKTVDKVALAQNVYNHNFKREYCHCNKNSCEEDLMLQCGFCEDFFHVDCLRLDMDLRKWVAESDVLESLWVLCKDCLNQHFNFLIFYPEIHLLDGKQAEEYEANKLFEIEIFEKFQSENKIDLNISKEAFETMYESLFFRSVKNSALSKEDIDIPPTIQDYTEIQEESSLGKRETISSISQQECRLLARKKAFRIHEIHLKSHKGTVLEKFFMQRLCTCGQCQATYLQIDPQSFVLNADPEEENNLNDSTFRDSIIEAKEKAAKERENLSSKDIREELLQNVSEEFERRTGGNMGHEVQVRVAHAISNLSESLKQMIENTNSQIITEDDVKRMIDDLRKRA